MPITSFSMAITTFISQNLGAQKYDRARKGARFGIISAVVLAELIGVLYYIFAPALIGIFDDNPGVIAYGVQQARTAALFYFLLAFSTLSRRSAAARAKPSYPCSSCSRSGAYCAWRISPSSCACSGR